MLIKTVLDLLPVLVLLFGVLGGEQHAGEKHEADADPVAVESPLPILAEVQRGCKRFGTPIVRFTVTVAGTTESHRYVRRTGCQKADREILEWLKKWRYTPAKRDAKPVKQKVTVVINFSDP